MKNLSLKKNSQIGVYWLDAVLYAKPRKLEDIPKPTRTFTVGSFYEQDKDWIVIKAPLTYQFNEKDNEYEPKWFDKEPTFFSIPKGMIVKIVPGETEPRV